MYTPTKLKIKNLMSYQDLEVNLQTGATLIYGVNDFDEGQNGNGSGKSVIMEALVLAFTGKPMRPDTTPRDLIRREEEEVMEVTLELSNPMLNTELKIHRVFHSKRTKSQEVTITEGTDPVDVTDANHANQVILDFLDIPKEDLMNYYLIDKMRFQSFFSGGDAAKKKVIGRFSNIELLDPAVQQVKDKSTEFSKLIAIEDQSRSREEGSISAYTNTLEQEKSRDQNAERQQAITRIRTTITEHELNISAQTASKVQAEGQIKGYDEKITALKGRIATGQGLIDQVGSSKLEITESINEVNEMIREIKDKTAEADRLLIGRVECPECKHEFNASDPSKDLTKVKNAIPMLKEALAEQNIYLAEDQEDIKGLNEKETTLTNLKRTLNQDLNTLESELSKFQRTIPAAEQSIKTSEETIKTSNQSIKDLEETKTVNKTADIQKIIKQHETNIIEIDKHVEAIEKDITKNDDMLTHFNRFKTQLVNKTVGVIEFYTNKYLDAMKSSISVTISGYKENKAGGISEKISTMVNRNGVEIGSIGPFSQGERGRIDIAGILALQSQINSKSTSGGLNLLFLDEIVESIDEEGITNILKSLDDLGKCIYIITHSVYNGNHDKVVRVTKEDKGVSVWESL
tara:strand:- start:48757 stop:50649 length:1893 start_codon:yes stop_codon:yes gene_type:complete